MGHTLHTGALNRATAFPTCQLLFICLYICFHRVSVSVFFFFSLNLSLSLSLGMSPRGTTDYRVGLMMMYCTATTIALLSTLTKMFPPSAETKTAARIMGPCHYTVFLSPWGEIKFE